MPRSTVQESRYAEILGIPVAAFGIGAYAGLLLSTLLRGEVGVLLGLLVALVGALFSVYLTWMELFAIHAVCHWCVTSAIFMAVSLLLAAIRVRSIRRTVSVTDRKSMDR